MDISYHGWDVLDFLFDLFSAKRLNILGQPSSGTQFCSSNMPKAWAGTLMIYEDWTHNICITDLTINNMGRGTNTRADGRGQDNLPYMYIPSQPCHF